jgi:phosphoribosylformylglycinamidine synthase
MDSVMVRIIIKKKQSVLDVEGKTIANSLNQLGFDDVLDVFKGNVVDVKIKCLATDKQKIDELVGKMCSKILVNDIIESYEYQILSK